MLVCSLVPFSHLVAYVVRQTNANHRSYFCASNRDDEQHEEEAMRGHYSIFFGPRAGPEVERRNYWNRIWQTYLGTGESKIYTFGMFPISCLFPREYGTNFSSNAADSFICTPIFPFSSCTILVALFLILLSFLA